MYRPFVRAGGRLHLGVKILRKAEMLLLNRHTPMVALGSPLERNPMGHHRDPIKARPTLYKGIRMRSRLEASFAAALDHHGLSWEYEPTCFAGPDGQWLPDFRLTTWEDCYIEVKPPSLLTGDAQDRISDISKILTQMSVAWLSEPETPIELVVWKYGTYCPGDSLLSITGNPPWSPGGRVLWTVSRLCDFHDDYADPPSFWDMDKGPMRLTGRYRKGPNGRMMPTATQEPPEFWTELLTP